MTNLEITKKAIRLADLNGLKTTLIDVADLVELHNEINRVNMELSIANKELKRRDKLAREFSKAKKAIKVYTLNELKRAIR